MSQQKFINPLQAVVLGSILFLLLSAKHANAGPVQVFDIDAYNPKVVRVTDLCPGPCTGAERKAVVYAAKILFAGTQQNAEDHLWALDSNNVLTLVHSSNPGGKDHVGLLTPVDGDLYFRAFNPNTGHELWKYNGTNTTLVQDFAAGPTSSFPVPLLEYNGDLLLFARADTGHGVYKFRNGAAELVALGSEGHGAVIHQGDTWLGFNDTQFGEELWRYDGNNFFLANDILPGPESSYPLILGSVNDELVYSAGDWDYQSIFKGDLSLGSVSSFNSEVHNDQLYYGGDLDGPPAGVPTELIRYDGVAQVPLLEANVAYMKFYKQSLIFSGSLAGAPPTGDTFRYRNGIAEPLDNGIPGVPLVSSRNFIEFSNKLYFQAFTEAYGFEWWSLTEGPKLSKVQMQLMPIWDNRYLWQLDLVATGAPLDLTYAVYKYADTGTITQVAREQIYLDEHTAHTNIQEGKSGFSGREQGIATLVVAFDSKTYRKLFQYVEVIGKDKSFGTKASARLEGDARKLGQRLIFQDLFGGNLKGKF